MSGWSSKDFYKRMKIRRIELVDGWYLIDLVKYPYHIKHDCRLWEIGDDKKLPKAGNGPHYRTMPYCPKLERYWCRYCGAVATREATDLALLARVVNYELDWSIHRPTEKDW